MTTASENMAPEFFHRFEGLCLTPGNKSAGFDLVVSTEVLKRLRAMPPIDEYRHSLLQQTLRQRILNAKLLPKKIAERCGVVLDAGTMCPRCFITDPQFGGSIGADPSELERLTRLDAVEWLGPTMVYSPHNVDTPSDALALVVMVETWAEMARMFLMTENP